MPNRRHLALVAALVIAAVLAVAMAQSVLRRADTSENYPAYSSLNNGENGTKAYFEALARLGFAPSRNYKMLSKIFGLRAAVFYAGQSLSSFRYSDEKDLEQFEKLATRGARILIALDPEAVISIEKPKQPGHPVDSHPPEDNLKKRWGVELSYVERTIPQDNRELLAKLNMLPVNWQFSSWPNDWTPSRLRNGSPLFLERVFGTGGIVLIANSKLFTNRELLVHPDTEVLAVAPGAYHNIVFDENHLGLADTGTVLGIAAAHGLAWMLLGFLVLAILYVWRSSVSFVPPAAAPVEAAVGGRDAHLALSHLLMQSVPSKSVLRAAGEEWNRSAALQAHYPGARSTARTLSPGDLRRLDHLPPDQAAAEYRALTVRFSRRYPL